MVGGCCIDNFFKLRGLVAETVTTNDACLSEKLYCVIDCCSADAEVALGHRSTNSLNIEMLVHLQNHAENSIALRRATQAFCSEIAVESFNC